MPSWGDYELFTTGEISSPFPSITIARLNLVPSGDASTPASTLQIGGRERKIASGPIFVETQTEYESLYLDHLSSAIKTYTGARGEVMQAIIEKLSPPVYFIDGSIECDITFIEV